jgi:xylulokinase
VNADECLIGIDIGTSSVKAVALGLATMQVVAHSKVQTTVSAHGIWVEMTVADLRSSVELALRKLLSALPERSRPLAVAVSSFGESGAHLGVDGQALGSVIMWQDQRSAQQVASLVERVGADELDSLVGHAPDPTWGIGRIMWAAESEPWLMDATATWLPVADLVTYWLCGESVTSAALASRVMAVDQERRDWSAAVLTAAGIDRTILPPILDSGTHVGSVTDSAAARTGLPARLAVCLGGHDRLWGAFAARGPTELAVDSVGTAEGLVIPAETGHDARRVRCSGIAWYWDVVPASHVYAGRVGLAGGLLEWARKSFFPEGTELDDVLSEIHSPYRFKGVVCSPTHGRATSPYWSPTVVPTAFSGITGGASRADLVQAVLEAPAFSLRANLDTMARWTGRQHDRFLLEGGMSGSPMAVQLRADVTGRQVGALEDTDLGAVGAGLLAGVGVGVFASHREAQSGVQLQCHFVDPDARRSEEYRRAYEEAWSPLMEYVSAASRRA